MYNAPVVRDMQSIRRLFDNTENPIKFRNHLEGSINEEFRADIKILSKKFNEPIHRNDSQRTRKPPRI